VGNCHSLLNLNGSGQVRFRFKSRRTSLIRFVSFSDSDSDSFGSALGPWLSSPLQNGRRDPIDKQ